jgi:hypothetical protein
VIDMGRFRAVKAVQTYGSFGSVESVDGLAQEAADEASGYYGDIMADGTGSGSMHTLGNKAGYALQGFGAYGAVPVFQHQFCGNNPKPTPAQAIAAREAFRKKLADKGIPTYPGRSWQPSEQAAWNAYNKSQGLAPMLFGKYPMGTQCDAMNYGSFVVDDNRKKGIAGFGTLAINGKEIGGADFSLGSFVAQRAVYGLIGWYVGSKLGPKGSSAGVAGGIGCALAGPLGLAITAACYAK